MKRSVSVALLALLMAACAGHAGGSSTSSIRLYTSVTQETVDSVTAGFRAIHPDIAVETFRAPTGELNGRLAAERSQGGISADVLWLTDPLSMQQYASDDLLLAWTPRSASVVPARFRSETFWATRLLTMLVVERAGLQPPVRTWRDLAEPSYRGRIAVPDPAVAGSAFGVLGYFVLDPAYGMDFYRALHDNGAIQVASPGDVVTGVAQGRFDAGITLDAIARAAEAKGSPVESVLPEPGGIAMYSPIAVLASTDEAAAAEAFVDYVLDKDAQQRIAATGWQPVRSDVGGPAPGGPVVTPDWTAFFDRQTTILTEYRDIFGG